MKDADFRAGSPHSPGTHDTQVPGRSLGPGLFCTAHAVFVSTSFLPSELGAEEGAGPLTCTEVSSPVDSLDAQTPSGGEETSHEDKEAENISRAGLGENLTQHHQRRAGPRGR